ncbi:ZIP family metal transporter [Desulfoscipio gibsoniae]|uniref:Putative divalent heavy-metal cations transporter n=1 Tax=Desulfoscipio gibsoniae DSM 7213 TaxID=767817 RepID=R4KJC1_9FIRM|nr:ZIP family metal transporter [Desulfoscipio gibsoniae]AGK99730.1 putative divalent heavy-metal cations transporter [Desulfoscipio gibsoniae DSM 7213]
MINILIHALIAGLGTCLGAAVIMLFGQMKEWMLALLLGLASGVMAAVVMMDLLPTSLAYGSPGICLLGFAGGFLLVNGLDFLLTKLMPGRHTSQVYLRMGYLIALGIAMHDLPEGIAIAAGYSASAQLGPMLALAIGLHNIPEGMATAAPLRASGMGGGRVITLNALISLVTPLGTLLGLFILQASPAINALLLALAAGAMIFIVTEKLVPASMGNHGIFALCGMAIGFCFMLRINSLF